MFGLFSKKSPPLKDGQRLIAKKARPGGSGFTYIQTRTFNESNLGRYARPRTTLPPAANFAGAAGIPVQRCMEVLKPAVAMQGNTILHNDPRGLAGNSPVHTTTSMGPLVDLSKNNFANPTPIG